MGDIARITHLTRLEKLLLNSKSKEERVMKKYAYFQVCFGDGSPMVTEDYHYARRCYGKVESATLWGVTEDGMFHNIMSK